MPEWTLPCPRMALLVTPMIKKTMTQIMLQTEALHLLAPPQTMFFKQSPTAQPDPTLSCLTFSPVAERLHNLTSPPQSGFLRMKTHTFLSTLPNLRRAAAFTKFLSRLLQFGARQDSLPLPRRAVAFIKLPSRLLQASIRQD
jgi:hypothetical protein